MPVIRPLYNRLLRQSSVSSAGLVFWMRGDYLGFDATGNGSGQVVGTTNSTTTPRLDIGPAANTSSIRFGNATNAADYLNFTARKNSATTATFAFWQKWPSDAGYVATDGNYFLAQGDGSFATLGVMALWNGNTWTTSTSANYNDGKWHFVVITYASSTASFFKDTIADGSSGGGSASLFITGAYSLRLGSRSGQNIPNKSTYHDFRIYDRVLSQAEIKALYAEPWQTPLGVETLALGPQPLIFTLMPQIVT